MRLETRFMPEGIACFEVESGEQVGETCQNKESLSELLITGVDGMLDNGQEALTEEQAEELMEKGILDLDAPEAGVNP